VLARGGFLDHPPGWYSFAVFLALDVVIMDGEGAMYLSKDEKK
jgi:hypothetical protein